MALPDLHLFVEDLKKKPGRGDGGPPRSIRARDLDDNYAKVTLMPPKGVAASSALYELRYDKDGTRITRILPKGSSEGDLLYFDGSNWVVLPAVDSETMHVLTITNGNLAWTATQDCA